MLCERGHTPMCQPMAVLVCQRNSDVMALRVWPWPQWIRTTSRVCGVTLMQSGSNFQFILSYFFIPLVILWFLNWHRQGTIFWFCNLLTRQFFFFYVFDVISSIGSSSKIFTFWNENISSLKFSCPPPPKKVKVLITTYFIFGTFHYRVILWFLTRLHQ